MPFDDYYAQQSGSGAYSGPMWQEGGSIRGFAGRDFQYGNGLGSFGRTLYRWAKPIFKYLGREGLKAGMSVGNDVLAGSNIKDSVIKRAKESGSKIVTDAATVVQKKLTGKGMAKRRRGTRGKSRKKTVKRTVSRRKGAVRRRSRRKRVKSAKDYFT